MLYKITHDQSTSSPEEDQQYAVETSRLHRETNEKLSCYKQISNVTIS